MQRVASAISALVRSADRATSRFIGAPRPRWDAAEPFACLMPWELTSKDALTVPPRRQPDGTETIADLDNECGSQLLEYAGVCTISRAIHPALAARCCAAAHDLTQDVRQLLVQRGVDPDGPDGFSFFGAHQRDPGRMDLRNHFAMDEAPFDDSALNEAAVWMPLVHDVLGTDAHLMFKGLVMAEPGTGDQGYHADTPLVSRGEWARQQPQDSRGALLPAHCLVVFVPLVDLVDANGPTSFLPGSQHMTSYTSSLVAEASEPGTSGVRLPASLAVDAGDAIVFDARVQHAGAPNRSGERRPLLYLVYARPWFTVEYHRRLLEESGLTEPGVYPERIFRLRTDRV